MLRLYDVDEVYTLLISDKDCLNPIRHKTLEERAEAYGGTLNLDGEYDWGETDEKEF